MNNDKIIQKIKEENIKPISKSIFLFKKIIIWSLIFITTIFGIYTFALFFLKILFIDFDKWYFLSDTYDDFIIDNIPFIWLSLFCISIFTIFFLIRKTNKGYKYSILLISTSSLIISIILGLSLSKILAKQNIIMQKLHDEKMIKWTNPEGGRIMGEVLYKDLQKQYLLIRDINDSVWNVDISYILDDSEYLIDNNQVVSIIGRFDYDGNFTACQILSMDIPKDRFNPNPQNIDKVFLQKKHGKNRLTQEICDFVINK